MVGDISVVIPTIPPRKKNGRLEAALSSVEAQTLQPAATIVVLDELKQGAAANRQKGLDKVETEYVAFLDDDDELYPQHLEVLRNNIEDADLIYPWFDVKGGSDPFPQFEEMDWDCSQPRQIPITFLARTESIRAVGGFVQDFDLANFSTHGGEDYQLILRVCRAGMKVRYHKERTWQWNHHYSNTSGMPSRW